MASCQGRSVGRDWPQAFLSRLKQLKTGWSSVIRVHVEHLVPLAIMADEHIDSQPNFSGVDNMEVSHSCMLFFFFFNTSKVFSHSSLAQ